MLMCSASRSPSAGKAMLRSRIRRSGRAAMRFAIQHFLAQPHHHRTGHRPFHPHIDRDPGGFADQRHVGRGGQADPLVVSHRENLPRRRQRALSERATASPTRSPS